MGVKYCVVTLILPFELRVLITETQNHWTRALGNQKGSAGHPKEKECISWSQCAILCICTRDADIGSGMERATPYLILVTEESTAKTHSTKCLNSPFRVSDSLFNSITVHAPKHKPATMGKYSILQNLLKSILKSSISKFWTFPFYTSLFLLSLSPHFP